MIAARPAITWKAPISSIIVAAKATPIIAQPESACDPTARLPVICVTPLLVPDERRVRVDTRTAPTGGASPLADERTATGDRRRIIPGGGCSPRWSWGQSEPGEWGGRGCDDVRRLHRVPRRPAAGSRSEAGRLG